MQNFRSTHHPDVPNLALARWSGPAAMSAATGLTAEECAAAINASRDRPAYHQVQRLPADTLEDPLRLLGFTATRHDVAKGLTIREFAINRKPDIFLAPVILWTRLGFMALREKTLVEHLHEGGRPWRDHDRLTMIVLGFYEVHPDATRDQGLPDWGPYLHSIGARRRDGVARGAR